MAWATWCRKRWTCVKAAAMEVASRDDDDDDNDDDVDDDDVDGRSCSTKA
jgi:hypothetical protein